MKSNFKLFFSFLSMACIVFALNACGGNSQSEQGQEQNKEEQHKGHDHGSHDGHNHDGHNHNHDGHNHDHDGHDHGHEGHNHGEKDDASTVDMSAPEYASAYVCPMHCKGSGSDKAGTCPVCNMEYVLNAEHKEDGHKH